MHGVTVTRLLCLDAVSTTTTIGEIMKTTIWTLTVDHRHGVDTTVHGTAADAYAHLNAKFLGDELWDTEGHSVTVTEDMEAGDLLQWLCSGANEVSVYGPEPVVIEVPDVKIEVIHQRDPDSGCEFSYYVNGEPLHTVEGITVEEYTLDAGAGGEFESWAGQAASAKATASPAVWAELEEYYADPAGDQYLDGFPDEDDENGGEWLDHLDNTTANKLWWATHYPDVTLSYLFAGTWVPINDHPGDQRYDEIPSNDGNSYWGEIGPEDTDGATWSWTIIGHNDAGEQWDVESGIVTSEYVAKARIENWVALADDDTDD